MKKHPIRRGAVAGLATTPILVWLWYTRPQDRDYEVETIEQLAARMAKATARVVLFGAAVGWMVERGSS